MANAIGIVDTWKWNDVGGANAHETLTLWMAKFMTLYNGVDAYIKEQRGGTTDIEAVDNRQEGIDIKKVLRNGQAVIIREGRTFDLMGREL